MSNKPPAFFFMLGVMMVLLTAAGCSKNSAPASAKLYANQGSAVSQVDKTHLALAELNRLSEELYSASNKGNRQLAYLVLSRLEKAASLPIVRQSGSQQGWAAFDKSLGVVRKAIASENSNSLWYMPAAQIKLASDALVRPEAALWLQYEDVLEDDESRLLQAWQLQSKGNIEAALISLHIFSEHLQRFEVAALMQRDAALLLSLRNQAVYTEKLLSNIERNGKQKSASIPEAFQNLITARNQLFQGNTDPALAAVQSEPRMIIPDGQSSSRDQLAILYISAIVMGVLSLAGWRRFAYERRRGAAYSASDLFKKK